MKEIPKNRSKNKTYQNALERQTECIVNRNRMLDIAITWLPWLGALIIGVAFSIWYGGGNKSYAIWAGSFGIVVAVFGFAFHLQKIVWDSAGENGPSEAEIKEKRAYVISDKITVNWGKDELSETAPITAWKFVISWKNTGQTPAQDFHAQPDIVYFDAGGMPDDFALASPYRPTPPITIGKDQSRDVGNVELPMSAIQEMRARTRRFYLWVSSNYRDIYDGTPIRHTDFAAEIKIKGDVAVPGAPFEFEFVRQHSRTD